MQYSYIPKNTAESTIKYTNTHRYRVIESKTPHHLNIQECAYVFHGGLANVLLYVHLGEVLFPPGGASILFSTVTIWKSTPCIAV